MDLNNFAEQIKKIKRFPPIAEKIEMYQEGYDAMKKEADKKIVLDHYDSICGVKILVTDYIYNARRNECKIHFSDGSTKIMPIFDLNNKAAIEKQVFSSELHTF